MHDGSLARVGEKIAVAESLAAEVMGDAKVADFKLVAQFKGKDLAGTICSHPWRGRDYDFDVPCIAGDHVTTDAGTGFVHTAPGHGQEDWEVSKEYGIAVPDTVGPDGCYYEQVPIFAGEHVYKVAPAYLGTTDRSRLLAGLWQNHAQLSLFVAFQSQVDFPQHAAMVHFHGRQQSA